MSLDLYIGPRRDGRWRIIGLLALILIILGVVAWKRGWPVATWGQEVLSDSPLPVESLPLAGLKSLAGPAEPEPVVMVKAQVIESPHSPAYTAELYRDTGTDDPLPWPNAGGRTGVLTYVVEEGDTLWTIAARFELDLDTLRWSNPALERNPDVLAVGTELIIPPVNGVYHLVSPGDTLASIAARYGVTAADIAQYPPNGLYPPYELEAGQGLIVPGGRKDQALPQPTLAADSELAWPLAGGITGGFEPDHQALDIGAPYAATVYAAGAGQITYAGWGTDGLGYTVIIDHGDGLESWYVHLKGALLPAGSYVNRGQAIGEVGSTGHSTGPHLHFEVRLNGERVNPIEFLPSEKPK